MSNISEAETTDLSIPGYSGNVSHHTKESLNFTKKIFDTTKTSTVDSERTEDVFSPDQTDAILDDLRTFALDGLKITNCIFRREHVEICYLFQSSGAHNKDELRQKLANHLKIDSQLIKMTKLRTKPIYKETSIKPGETVAIDSKGNCKIGAFVDVEGKGNHALSSGHGKEQDDVLFYPNGDRLGVINVSLHPPLQLTASDNWCYYYSDVALVRLEEQHRYNARINSDIQGPLGLMEQPIYATNGMMVRRYASDGGRGRVDSKDYNILDDAFKIKFRLISVVSDDGGAIHDEGDSGILIAIETPVNGRVNAVGILVRLEQMNEDNEEHTVRVTSLAVPLPANFEALRTIPTATERPLNFLTKSPANTYTVTYVYLVCLVERFTHENNIW